MDKRLEILKLDVDRKCKMGISKYEQVSQMGKHVLVVLQTITGDMLSSRPLMSSTSTLVLNFCHEPIKETMSDLWLDKGKSLKFESEAAEDTFGLTYIVFL